MYAPNVLDDANAAVYKFSANNTDPKAAMIAAYNFYMGQVRNGVCASCVLSSHEL